MDFTSALRDGLVAYLAEIVPGWAEPDRAAAARLWLELESIHYPRYLRGELTFQGQRQARTVAFGEARGLPVGDSPAEVDQWFAGYLTYCEAEFRLFPDVRPALDRLDENGIRIAALSNSTHAYQEHKLRLLDIHDRFEALICCDDVNGVAKPDPLIFKAACAALGVPPSDVIYVGDRVDDDARAATRAGLRGVWLNRAADRRAPDTPTVFDLGELADLACR